MLVEREPAYRCRHGYASSASPDPDRPKNTYVREDQILPHPAAIAILLAGDAGKPGRTSGGPAQLTGPAGAAALIGQLRADGTVLTTTRPAGPCVPAVTTHRRSPSARPPLKLTRASTGKGGQPSGRGKEHPPRPEAERG